MIKPCTSEFMISDVSGIGMARAWFPRVVAESFVGSTKDGEINRAPDPVPMITAELSWFNNTNADQDVTILVHRAPRSVTTTNPVTVVIQDAWTFDVGPTPSASQPTATQDAFGGRLQLDRADVNTDDLHFGRMFLDGDDCQTYVAVGIVPAGEGVHMRYLAAVQTPGTWTTAEEPRYEAYARWVRLIALASPIGA